VECPSSAEIAANKRSLGVLSMKNHFATSRTIPAMAIPTIIRRIVRRGRGCRIVQALRNGPAAHPLIGG
jgi:hypothetical protein